MWFWQSKTIIISLTYQGIWQTTVGDDYMLGRRAWACWWVAIVTWGYDLDAHFKPRFRCTTSILRKISFLECHCMHIEPAWLLRMRSCNVWQGPTDQIIQLWGDEDRRRLYVHNQWSETCCMPSSGMKIRTFLHWRQKIPAQRLSIQKLSQL